MTDDNGGNGHKKTEEEKEAEQKARCENCSLKEACHEAEQRSKCVEERLKDFSDWLDSHEEEINELKVDATAVAAYCLARSENSIMFVLNPDIITDIILLMTYAYWAGRTAEKVENV